MFTRWRRLLRPVAGAAAIALLSGCGAERPRPLALATGTTAGVYYPLGGALASRWTRDLPGLVVKAEVSAGSVTNLIQVAKGESDIGFGQADAVADAF
ncbi:MAG: TRAP transporter substrate-binding protein, partial [Acidobacteria bacterium]|nr:TRAP transporter substrate-binding protein [Acidobacteriota bacterium]